MKTSTTNYGIQREYGSWLETLLPGVMSARDERALSVLAQLSTFFFTGILGPVVAFVIWLVHKDD
jgi:hypothetical protein